MTDEIKKEEVAVSEVKIETPKMAKHRFTFDFRFLK